MVTEFHAGDMVEIELDETIPHPGYFRVALAKDRSEFTIPPVDNPSSCALDLSKVPTGAHDNILADGLWKEESQPSARHLTTMVKLPDQPCDKCTIQVVQVMKDHGLNSCYYYHCADIKILPASGSTGSAGASAAGSGGTAGGVAGAGGSAAGAPAAGAGGAGGARASVAGSTAPATAGTTGGAGVGAAGRVSTAAGSVAAPSGGAGSPGSPTGAAGVGTTTSPMLAAGAPAAAGGGAPIAPAQSSSGCALAGAPASSAPLAVRGPLAALVFACLLRVRRRRSSVRRGNG